MLRKLFIGLLGVSKLLIFMVLYVRLFFKVLGLLLVVVMLVEVWVVFNKEGLIRLVVLWWNILLFWCVLFIVISMVVFFMLCI